jgi:hypothetical protein
VAVEHGPVVEEGDQALLLHDHVRWKSARNDPVEQAV